MRLVNECCPKKFLVSITYIFIVSIMLYSFIPCKLKVHMLSNGIYTDITPHNWDQAVESFEFKL